MSVLIHFCMTFSVTVRNKKEAQTGYTANLHIYDEKDHAYGVSDITCGSFSSTYEI